MAWLDVIQMGDKKAAREDEASPDPSIALSGASKPESLEAEAPQKV